MHIVSVLNHKGGVGKTTFTGCTAQALALCGHRVCAIDNDSQHNLSTLLGVGSQEPSMRDIYQATEANAPEVLLRSIRKTEIPDLHIITANHNLRDADVSDLDQLNRTMKRCRLDRFYDFILIDNAPGIDRLQGSAINASATIFVPIELRQFAVDGLVEMEHVLASRYPDGAKISRIIPNFYKNTKRQQAFLAALKRLFPGKVTETAIAVDAVFDEVVTEGKILFLHRLYSKGAAFYLKIIHELFDLNEDTVWDQVVKKRQQRFSSDARKRLLNRQNRSDQSI